MTAGHVSISLGPFNLIDFLVQVDGNMPRNIEAAIARLGSVSQKAPCISTVDMHGKMQVSLTYGIE